MNTNTGATINHGFTATPQDPDPTQPPPCTTTLDPYPQQQTQRRPRHFAATMSNIRATTTPTKSRKERDKEKERTKLRERHRRAITSRMLAGLRQYGNFPLPTRADMNDVIASLAREAGWTVEPDGTTFRRSSPAPPPPPPTTHISSIPQANSNACNVGTYQVRSAESPLSSNSLKNCSIRSSVDCQPSALRIEESVSPVSLDSVVAGRNGMLDKCTSAGAGAINSPECLQANELIQDVDFRGNGNGLPGSSYVPVYARLAAGLINDFSQLMVPEGVREELQYLKSLQVDGIVVDCWWGIVEGWAPRKYEWPGYRELFNIIREFGMKLQVVMAFHEYGGHESGDVSISLPHWVMEIGKKNQDIFFTDREGRRNTECLSWGIDRERVLSGRTGIEGILSTLPCQKEWVGDILVLVSFSRQQAAKLRGHSFWARGPDNAGYYNSKPHETGFFCEKGDYDSYYGRFFFHWYTQVMIDHADDVLYLASLVFEEVQMAVKTFT